MAVLFMDGFDADDFAMKWDAVSGAVSTSSTTRFNSGSSLYFNFTYYIDKSISSSSFYAGFACRVTDSTKSGHLIWLFTDSGSTMQLRVNYNSGVLTLTRGYDTVIATASLQIAAATWYYIELTATISDTVGTFVMRIDGTEVINFSGDTRYGGTLTVVDKIRIGGNGTSIYAGGLPLIDDFYISDSGFLGDVRVITTVPTAAGSATDLTPTGGDNYANVADIPDSTATYNSSVTAGHKDLYTMGDIPASVTTIHAVQANSHAWKTDAGTKSLKNAIKSGTTTAYGATVSLPTSVAHQGDIFEVDPDTSAAWTVSGVNGVEAGAEVV